VPAAPSLDVGLGGGLTVEAWINPTDANLEQDLVEWNNSQGFIGVHLSLSVPFLSGGPGSLWANLVDTSGGAHQISTGTNVIASGLKSACCPDLQQTFGSNCSVPERRGGGSNESRHVHSYTSSDFYVGWRPSGPFTGLFLWRFDR